MKLTEATAKSLRLAVSESDRIWFDDIVPGFGIRKRSSGAATWIYQYKRGTKRRRMTFGNVGVMSVNEARSKAKGYRVQVKQGGDPAADKLASEARVAGTFHALRAKYLEHQQRKLRPGSFDQVKRHLNVHCKPLHKLPVRRIDHRTIAHELRKIANDSGDVISNRVRSTLSHMFLWGMGQGLAAYNPVIDTNDRAHKSQERILSDAELKIVWDALENNRYGSIIKLLILTVQRENEIAGLRWSEIDFKRNLIAFSSERTTNGRPHDVPIARTARELLEKQKRKDRELVFGRGGGPFSGSSRSRAALEQRIRQQTAKALPHWTLDDLRRTGATRMAEIGILPHVIEAVLNDVSRQDDDMAGIYNRANYVAEKAQALARWDEHIAGLLTGRSKHRGRERIIKSWGEQQVLQFPLLEP
jgi:integrase